MLLMVDNEASCKERTQSRGNAGFYRVFLTGLATSDGAAEGGVEALAWLAGLGSCERLAVDASGVGSCASSADATLRPFLFLGGGGVLNVPCGHRT